MKEEDVNDLFRSEAPVNAPVSCGGRRIAQSRPTAASWTDVQWIPAQFGPGNLGEGFLAMSWVKQACHMRV